MLPIYDEINFIDILDKGGRNKPWLVKVNVGDAYENYVIKIFDEDPENFWTASEVYGSILAKEFDLPTPDIALFEVTPETIMTFPGELQMYLEDKGSGIKFGNLFMEGSLQFDPTSSRQIGIVKNRIEMDTLYAFDQLINNIDRNSNRPNILIRQDEIMLIDHELAFNELNEDRQTQILGGNTIGNNYQHHIFYYMLRSASGRSKQDFFSTFQELLRS